MIATADNRRYAPGATRASRGDKVTRRTINPLPWRGYGIALLAVALAFAIRLILAPLIREESSFLLFFGAVTIAAWCGGLGPGLLATITAGTLNTVWFLPSQPLLFDLTRGDMVRLSLFLLEAAVISTITQRMHTARWQEQRERLARQESDERYRLLVEGVRDYAIYMLDPEGRLISWNEGAQRLTGYRAEEILGCHFTCFFPPEAVEQGKPQAILEAAKELGRTEDEGWRVRRDGTRFWANAITTALRDSNGTLRGFAKITRDTTERRQAEIALRESQAQLAGIVNIASDAIITIDEEQRITVFNRAAEQVFRCRAEDALGQSIDRFIPERFRSAHREHVRAFGRTEISRRPMARPGTVTGLRADGEEFPAAATISRLVVDGKTLYSVFLQDLTEQLALNRALEQQRTIATTLQRAFLPQRLPECPGYRLGALYHPALNESEVGGDFYDVFPLPDGGIALLMGDVSGKGVTAAVYAAMARSMLRAYAYESLSPGAALARLNRALCLALDDLSLFVTAFYAILDPERGVLCYANAGHWPALLVRSGMAEAVPGNSVALGIDPDASYTSHPLQLQPEDELLLFTDGLVELDTGDVIDHLDALRATLARSSCESPEQRVEMLYEEAVARAGGPLRDDVAILALHCERRPSSRNSVATIPETRRAQRDAS